MHICARTKQKRAHACQYAYQNVYDSWNFTKLVLVVYYYAMTLSLKFHKDLSFFCGDMRKIVLNMHARGINENANFRYMRVHVFALCARRYAQIFTKIFW